MNLKGKEFEALIMFRAGKLEEDRLLCLGRYGTQVVMMNDSLGVPRWQPIPSYPDFEGVIYGSGRQIIIEAKVCSQASYPIYATGKKRPKQIEHLLRRAAFGAQCYLLIHWNARDLKTKSEEAETFAIPVLDNTFWREYESFERKSLNRQEAGLFGFKVPWNAWSSRATKLTPDLSVLLPERPEFKLIN